MELNKVFERFFPVGGEAVQQQSMSNHTLAKLRLASHPRASAQSLTKLSQHGWENVVTRVAENINTPSDTLAKLATHAHSDVRVALTENPNTPVRVLILLAADDCVDVRYNLAENPNTPHAVLNLLCDDENPYVADRANRTINRIRQTHNAPSWLPVMRQRQQREIG